MTVEVQELEVASTSWQ